MGVGKVEISSLLVVVKDEDAPPQRRKT